MRGLLEILRTDAERQKFEARVVLVCGLWTAPRAWAPFASFLAHRGWSSVAVGRARAAGARDLLRSLLDLCSHESTPPFVVGHDAGGTLALYLENVRAVVCLAPLPYGTSWPHPVLRSWRYRLGRRLFRRARPPRRTASEVLEIPPGCLLPETTDWSASLRSLPPPPRGETPRLVLLGGRDPCVPAAFWRERATLLGAELETVEESGHGLPWNAHWPDVVSRVHRWMVRQGGEELLLLRGDEDLRE
ncbi:MAG: hypothetical protein KatS3mg076_1311 [Candidatus Binatia bacterium]|nr:MAG: hypothetical protein KatS3mg076_1311 [Candidatus Binatia bacterium]